jgi:hypothetical protein
MWKVVPYLKEMEKIIDDFRGNLTGDIPRKSRLQKQIPQFQEENPVDKCKDDLPVFSYVVKLLTGELLCHEQYLDHHAKIEPIVRHEIPEIPEHSLSSTQPQLYKAENMIVDNKPLRNHGNTIPTTNNAEISDGSSQLYGENMNLFCTGWQQCSYSTRNNCKSTVPSENLSPNYVNSGANLVKCKRITPCPTNHIVDTNVNTNKGMKKMLPRIEPKPVCGKVANSQITASVMTDNSAEQNLGGSSRRNVNAAVRTRRTREKQMSRSRCRNVTYNVRYDS